MIGHLRGSVFHLAPQLVVLDVGGVGYQVHIPLATYAEIERLGVGTEASLHVHTHVRDDTLQLFGFSSPQEKALFERLISISGIGPKLAQAILSGLPAAELAAAIKAGDLRRLNAIPGVGKKTAERLILELKDRIADLADPEAGGSGEVAIPGSPVRDAIDALVHLGYRAAQAERAVNAARKGNEDLPVGELVRTALRSLGGG